MSSPSWPRSSAKGETRDALVLWARGIHADALAAGDTIAENGLARSGRGADGVFGARALVGRNEQSDRLQLDIVSYVGTGASAGLLALLGVDYYDCLWGLDNALIDRFID